MASISRNEDKEENEDLLERMTSAEFRDYMLYMDLEDILSTEIWKSGKWLYLLTKSKKADKSYGAYCHACSERLLTDQVVDHLRRQGHIEALSKIQQFFHPAFTYFRGARHIMNGDKVSQKELKQAIELANGALVKPMSDVAVNFAQYIKEVTNDKSSNYSKVLEKIALNHPVNDYRHMFAEVTLPLLTLLNLEYSLKSGEWKTMLSATRPHPGAIFQCKLCDLSFGGISKIVAHLSSPTHKKKQLDCLEIRCKLYNFLTKNCVFRYGTTYSLTINNNARNFYKNEIARELKKLGDSDSKESEENEVQLPELPENVAQKGEALRLQRDMILEALQEEIDTKEKKSLKNEKRPEPSSSAPKDNKYDGKLVIKNDGLVGVEYIIRILKSSKNTLNDYVCTLCDKTLSERRMAEHLISYCHRSKYFETHYNETVFRYTKKMRPMKYPNFLRAFGLILAKLAAAVEAHHGYGAVREVPVSLYQRTRQNIIKEINRGHHASQERGPSFLNTISNNEIKEYVTNEDLYVDCTVKHETPERFCLRSEKNYKEGTAADRKVREKRSKSSERLERRGGRVRSKSRSPLRRRTRSRSQSHSRSLSARRSGKRNHSLSPRRQNDDIWSIYRREVSKVASQIELTYVNYRRNPETNRFYESEWNFFWKNRKEELIRQGIDHRGYDFQPEWMEYFKKRLETFFGEDLHRAQIEIRRRLNIPLDAEEDTPNLGHGKRERIEESNNWSTSPNESIEVSQPQLPTDNKLNVIHVLRLLTAFEDHLGSLGTKVMDLLTKALTLEKNLGNDPLEMESRLLNANNCAIIETAGEKLKGILFAGLLEPKKVNSFTNVIKSTDELLRHAENMGYRNVKEEEETATNARSNDASLQQILSALQKGSIKVGSPEMLSETLRKFLASQNNNTNVPASSNKGNNNHNNHNNNHNNRKDKMMDKSVGQNYRNDGGPSSMGQNYRNDGGPSSMGNLGNQFNPSFRGVNNTNLKNLNVKDQRNDRFNNKISVIVGASDPGYNLKPNQPQKDTPMGSGLLSFDTNLRSVNTGFNMGGNFDQGNMHARNMAGANTNYNPGSSYQSANVGNKEEPSRNYHNAGSSYQSANVGNKEEPSRNYQNAGNSYQSANVGNKEEPTRNFHNAGSSYQSANVGNKEEPSRNYHNAGSSYQSANVGIQEEPNRNYHNPGKNSSAVGNMGYQMYKNLNNMVRNFSKNTNSDGIVKFENNNPANNRPAEMLRQYPLNNQQERWMAYQPQGGFRPAGNNGS